MNPRADNQELLDDVLAEASPADFRAALLDGTLRLARRRRRFRQTRRAAGVLAVVVLSVILVRQNGREPSGISQLVAKRIIPPAYQLVRTGALPVSAMVKTRAFSENQQVASSAGVVEVTTIAGGYRQINDAELLALVAQRPVVLIRTGPHSEELVFANPEDQKGFPLN